MVMNKMNSVSIAEAKARLSELVDRVASGQTIAITRRGKAVARLAPTPAPRKPIDVAALRALTEAMPKSSQGAGKFMRALRESGRF
jgi:prevent-host-death family protein